MLGEFGRGAQRRVFDPLAKVLARLGVRADTITWGGTLAVIAAAWTFFPLGLAGWGAIVLGILLWLDSLDGALARLSGTSSPWGDFLDSTLDRISDGAVFAAIAWWAMNFLSGPQQSVGVGAALGCLVFGSAVPYIRAKAAAIGVQVKRGFLERTDRLIISLVSVGLTDFFLPLWLGLAGLAFVAAGSLFTTLQRCWAVWQGWQELKDQKEAI